MIFSKMQSQEAVLASFRNAKAQAEQERILEAEMRRAILDDDFRDLIIAKIRTVYQSEEILRDVEPCVSQEHNLLKKVCSELSTVYQWGAQRTLVKSGAPDARALELASILWEECAIDETLEKADYYLTGLRDLLLVPRVVNGKMVVDILTPDRLKVGQNFDDPTQIDWFSYQRARVNTPGAPETAVTIYADAFEWRYYDQVGDLVARVEHGLGRLPAVVVHASKRVDEFFDQTSMADVADATLTIGMLLAFMTRLQKWQSEKQLTYSGRASDINTGTQIGAHTVLATTSGAANGQWSLLEMQSNPQFYIDAIQARIAWVAQQHGIAADVYAMTDSSSSGFQFRLKRLPLLEQRAKRQKVWTRIERELWLLMSAVARDPSTGHPLAKALPVDVELKVRHLTEPNVEDPLVQVQVWERSIAIGVMSQVDAIEERLGGTREEAIERAKRVAGDRAMLAALLAERNMSVDPSKANATPEQNGATSQDSGPSDGGMEIATSGERPAERESSL